MKTLLIDTAHRAGYVAMGNEIRHFEDTRKMSDQLASVVQEMWNGPDRIAVGRGPGSFTGMRVGIALARGLSMGSGIPLVGFCSLEAYFPEGDGPFVAAFDARAGGVYYLNGERRGEVIDWETPQVGPVETLQNQRIVSPDREGLLARDPNLTIEERIPQIGALRFSDDIEALYMRKTQAERALES